MRTDGSSLLVRIITRVAQLVRHSVSVQSLSLSRSVESAHNQVQKFFIIKRFDQKAEGSTLHNRCFGSRIFMTGDENYPRLWRFRAKMRQQFHSGHAFHPDVQHGNWNRICCQILKKRVRFTKCFYFESRGLKQTAYCFSDGWIIIN